VNRTVWELVDEFHEAGGIGMVVGDKPIAFLTWVDMGSIVGTWLYPRSKRCE
jgi:hypothetical protein